MAGSHEVRGSNPLFSTMNSIAGRTIGQRFFISKLEGSNPARFFVRGGFYSTASPRLKVFLLGYLGPMPANSPGHTFLPISPVFVPESPVWRVLCRDTSFFVPRFSSGGSGLCPGCTLRGQPGFAPLLSCLFVPVALQSCFLTCRNYEPCGMWRLIASW